MWETTEQGLRHDREHRTRDANMGGDTRPGQSNSFSLPGEERLTGGGGGGGHDDATVRTKSVPSMATLRRLHASSRSTSRSGYRNQTGMALPLRVRSTSVSSSAAGAEGGNLPLLPVDDKGGGGGDGKAAAAAHLGRSHWGNTTAIIIANFLGTGKGADGTAVVAVVVVARCR